jgi:hypothetical protein
MMTCIRSDREGIVRHLLVNDLDIGRSVDECLRMLDALLFVEKHGEVCPANWRAGSPGIKPESPKARGSPTPLVPQGADLFFFLSSAMAV